VPGDAIDFAAQALPAPSGAPVAFDDLKTARF